MPFDKFKRPSVDNIDPKTVRKANEFMAVVNEKPHKFEPYELKIIKRMDEDPGATKTLRDGGILVDDPSFNKQKQ